MRRILAREGVGPVMAVMERVKMKTIEEPVGQHTAQLSTRGKSMFFSPSSSDADPLQVFGFTMTTSGHGHGSGRVQAPSLSTGLRT